jgi:hypothetical protein
MSPVYHCWKQAFRIVGFLGCCPNLDSSWCRGQREGRLSDHIARVSSCLMSRLMVVTPSFTHLNITFSNQRFSNCSPTVDVGVCEAHIGRTIFVETGSSRWIFSSVVTCAAVVLWFLKTLFSVRQYLLFFFTVVSLYVIVEFHPLFLFAGVVFPWFVYADITLQTVALDTPNNVAVFIPDAPANPQQRSVLFQNRTGLPFPDFVIPTVTQHNHQCTYTSTTECKQTEECSVLLAEVLSM